MQRIHGKLCGPDKQPLAKITRDELLWFLRTEMEEIHWFQTRTDAVQYTYVVSAHDAATDSLPDMEDHHWIDTCNKSVPVYIMPGGSWLLLRVVLHNYIYRRWFCPYRSEIDHERFICRFIYPKLVSTEITVSLSAIRDIVSINKAICDKVEAQRSSYEEIYKLRENPYGGRLSGRNPTHHIVQPLFRALLIVVSDEKYNKETSRTVGSLPVHLVRTGIEEGLSAPISFEPIAPKILSHIEPERIVQVTVETAIDFVMDLEARETAAFGLRPDPVTDWQAPEYMTEDWKLTGETDSLAGPNSQWVNEEKYPTWTGAGEQCDSVKMVQLEELQFRLEVKFERNRKAFKARQAASQSAADKKLME